MSDSDIARRLGNIVATRADRPFQASTAQRATKAQMWKRGEDLLPPMPDRAVACRFVDDTANLAKWWDEPGFQTWLWNRNEFDERLDYLASIVLDKFESILMSAASSDSSKIAAAKIILEAGRKLGKSTDQPTADDKIAGMDRKQLEAYIQRGLKLIPDTDDNK